jgi:hypothetical protein
VQVLSRYVQVDVVYVSFPMLGVLGFTTVLFWQVSDACEKNVYNNG